MRERIVLSERDTVCVLRLLEKPAQADPSPERSRTAARLPRLILCWSGAEKYRPACCSPPASGH